jgi:hypothetical protein
MSDMLLRNTGTEGFALCTTVRRSASMSNVPLYLSSCIEPCIPLCCFLIPFQCVLGYRALRSTSFHETMPWRHDPGDLRNEHFSFLPCIPLPDGVPILACGMLSDFRGKQEQCRDRASLAYHRAFA